MFEVVERLPVKAVASIATARKEVDMKKASVLIAVALVGSALLGTDAGAGGAAGAAGFDAKLLFEYPPAKAAWHSGEGLPDPKSKTSSALHLEQPDPAAPVGTRAGAPIGGAPGVVLTELGFDYRNGDFCSDVDAAAGQLGSPRYKIFTEPDGAEFHFACAAGDAAPTPGFETSWTRVRFTDGDAYSRTGEVWPGFNNVVIRKMFILFGGAEDIAPNFSGLVHLDNLDINGYLIGKR